MEAMLNELFGAGWANLLANTPADETAGGIFGILFGLFNASISVAALGILFVVGVTAVGDTSHKGEVMGKYNTMWVPIRSVMAAGFLVPIAKGFSLLQILILMVVVNFSLTLANAMASAAVTFMVGFGGTLTDPVARQTDGMAEQMLYTSVCETFYNEVEYTDAGAGPGTGQIVVQRDEWIEGLFNFRSSPWKSKIEFAGDALSGQGPTACGSYTVTCHDSEEESIQMCRKHVAAIDQLYADVKPIAEAIVFNIPLEGYAGSLASASIRFENNMRRALDERLSAIPVDERRQQMQSDLIASVEECGFVCLGQWYLVLTQLNNKVLQYAEPTIDSEPIDQSKATDIETGFGPHLQKTEAYVLKKSVRIANSPEANERALIAEKKLARLGEEGAWGPDFLSRNGDPSRMFGLEGADFGYDAEPIVGLQKLGNWLVTSVASIWTVSKVGGVIVKKSPTGKAAGLFNKVTSVLGAKDKSKKTSRAMPDLSDAAAAVSYLMMILFLAGLVLLYYVPAVPFLLWTVGVVGYLIVLIESLVAAPLWAASHAMPNGEGFASDASRQGYNLMVNLAVRPPLMVIGLFAGGILMLVVTSFAVHAFHIYAVSLMANRFDFLGLFSFAVLLVIEVVFVVGIIHKTHTLISELSDKVVEWITNHSRSTADGQDERAIGAVVTNRASHAGESALQSGAGAGRASRGGGSTAGPRSPNDPAQRQRFNAT